jgi:hypothetical protein
MHMTGLRRRIAQRRTEPKTTDGRGATRKLVGLVERARQNGRKQGPLAPVEALITVARDEWVWQVVDRDILDSLSHRLGFQSSVGARREILMTAGIDAAMNAASKIVELDGGCVLIETLDP